MQQPNSSYRTDNEMRLRYELWLRHGHSGVALYGDDGEMQCHECPLDFKRDEIDRIVDVLHYGDVARMVKADQVGG